MLPSVGPFTRPSGSTSTGDRRAPAERTVFCSPPTFPLGDEEVHGSAVRPEPPFLAARPSSPEPHRSLWSRGGGHLRGGSWPPALRSAARVQCSSRGPGCRGDSCIPQARTFWRPEVGCFLPVGAARDGAGRPGQVLVLELQANHFSGPQSLSCWN